MLWGNLLNKNIQIIFILIAVIISTLFVINCIQKMGKLERELEVEKQINSNLQKRIDTDESVRNKSDYDVCIANGGLHENCK